MENDLDLLNVIHKEREIIEVSNTTQETWRNSKLSFSIHYTITRLPVYVPIALASIIFLTIFLSPLRCSVYLDGVLFIILKFILDIKTYMWHRKMHICIEHNHALNLNKV